MSQTGRDKRAAALRANLTRRKVQQRLRTTAMPPAQEQTAPPTDWTPDRALGDGRELRCGDEAAQDGRGSE